MKSKIPCFAAMSVALFVCASTVVAVHAAAVEGPYKLINATKVGGEGGFDYVYADSDARRLYIPRGNRVTVYDLDTLKSAGTIPNTNGVHGAAVDPEVHHGFSSSNPVVMWDSKTLETIKTIDVQGRPDGILFDAATSCVYILSHASPHVTAISTKDGSLVGTVDIGGAPEQAASDGKGHLYIDIEDKSQVAVVDAKAMKLTATYDLGGKGGTPAGLSMDVKNRILFVGCRNPATCVVMNADTGAIITSLPIGSGIDAAVFNPATMEAISSQGDGTLTFIKEKSPTEFEVEQTVVTKPGAKTATLDSKTNQIYLITAERAPAAPSTAPSSTATPSSGAATPEPRRGRVSFVPDSFTILTVGK